MTISLEIFHFDKELTSNEIKQNNQADRDGMQATFRGNYH